MGDLSESLATYQLGAVEPSTSHVSRVTSAAHAARDSAKDKLHLHNLQATGPLRRFNPTNVRVHVKWDDDDSTSSLSLDKVKSRTYLWRARDNRKGRKSIAVPSPKAPSAPEVQKPSLATPIRRVSRGIWHMCTTFAYWDMAFWSGWSYSIGSVLFVMDGAFSFRQEAFGDSIQPASLTTYGGPLCFFIGALLYQVGATMAYFEAVNDGSFQGSAMQRFLEGNEEASKQMVDEKIHHFFGHFAPSHLAHHHRHKEEEVVDPEAGWAAKDRKEGPGSIYPTGKAPAPRRAAVDFGDIEEGASKTYMTWRWYPSWEALRTRHVYEIGYLACSIQLLGATLYGITGLVDLPGILEYLSDWQTEAAFWIPQIVASVCFLSASLLFTLETQEKWYKPELKVLGWWIGAWAVVGSLGFLWIGISGAISYHYAWAEYQADVATIWGSAAYLISSLLQWYEAVNKRPYGELFEPGEMKSSQIHPI